MNTIKVYGGKASAIGDGDRFVAVVSHVEGRRVVSLVPVMSNSDVITSRPEVKRPGSVRGEPL